MDRKALLTLLILCLLVFVPYFFRDGLIGYDPYAFLNQVCMPEYAHSPFSPFTPLANLLISLIPCHIGVIKLLLFSAFFLTVLLVAQAGRYLHPEEGWKAGILLFHSPFLLLLAAKFENDAFAYPWIVLGFLFWVKAEYQPVLKPLETHIAHLPRFLPASLPSSFHAFCSQPKKVHAALCRLLGFLIEGIALFIWGGSAFVMIGMAITAPLLLLLTLPLLYHSGKTLFQLVGGSTIIRENVSVVGLLGSLLLNLGFLTPVLPSLTLFLGIIAFVNSKFLPLVIPLLALSFFHLLIYHAPRKIQWVVYASAFLIAFLTGLYIMAGIGPLQEDWEPVEYAIALHRETGKEILNEFSVGYLLDHKGYVARQYGFYEPGWLDSYPGNIVITQETLPCAKEDFGKYGVYSC